VQLTSTCFFIEISLPARCMLFLRYESLTGVILGKQCSNLGQNDMAIAAEACTAVLHLLSQHRCRLARPSVMLVTYPRADVQHLAGVRLF
jgi:hypothetical protein